jgi:predicted ATPase
MDRLARISINNLRSIAAVRLDLAPVTVLIGENGSGKSTIIEAMELLRRASDPGFFQQFYSIHRGMSGLLRAGQGSLALGVNVVDDEGKNPPLRYVFSLSFKAGSAEVNGEHLWQQPVSDEAPARVVFSRGPTEGIVLDDQFQRLPLSAGVMAPDRLLITSFGAAPPNRSIARLLVVLRGIEVHLGMDTLAQWAAQSIQRPSPLRGAGLLVPAERLSLLGHNLASAWFALRNDFDEAHWQHTMALVRLGLGDAIDSVNTRADPGGGSIALWLKRRDLDAPLPAANLSDGQLSWLAFVAMARLHRGRSLLAIDEPELHLHPALLGRAVALLSSLEGPAPVVLSTHSDRILELLDDPVASVRVCGLEPGGRTSLSVLDREGLARWLEEYGDLGQLRASGYLPRVLVPASETAG